MLPWPPWLAAPQLHREVLQAPGAAHAVAAAVPRVHAVAAAAACVVQFGQRVFLRVAAAAGVRCGGGRSCVCVGRGGESGLGRERAQARVVCCVCGRFLLDGVQRGSSAGWPLEVVAAASAAAADPGRAAADAVVEGVEGAAVVHADA